MKIPDMISSIFLLALLAIGALAQTIPSTPPSPLVFDSAKVLLVKNGKSVEVPVRVRFDGAQVLIEEVASGQVILKFENSDVKAAEYSYSKQRRWRMLAASSAAMGGGLLVAATALSETAAIVALSGLAVLPVGLVLYHTRSKAHWLTIRGANNHAVLRLDKRNFRNLIPALETQTGITVAWQGQRN